MDLFRRMFTGLNDKYSPPSSVDAFMPGFRQAYASFSQEAAQLERLARYEQNWRAFFGIGNDSPGKNEERRTKQSNCRINMTQITVLRNLAFAFSQPWKLSLEYQPVIGLKPGQPLPETEQKIRDKLGEMVRFVDDVFMKDNPGETIRIEGGLFCAVTGDVFLVAAPLVPDSLAVKYLDNGSVEPNLEDTLIRVQAVNPMFCAAEWSVDGISLTKLVTRYPVAFATESSIPNNPRSINPNKTGAHGAAGVFEQEITPTMVYERVYNKDRKIIDYNEKENPIGKVFAVHIRNIASPGRFGLDDVSAIRGLTEELNDRIVDVSDIISYHAAPTTLVFGARAGALEKGANKVWSGLPEKARVENLKLDGDMPAMNSHIENIRTMLKETTGVNSAALGADLAISNTSGVALHMKFYSMATLADLKWASWRPQIRLLAEIILKWGVFLKQIEVQPGMFKALRRAISVNFQTNLPKDEAINITDNSNAVKAGLRSLRKALSDMGVRDPDGELWEIEDTFTKYPKIFSLISGNTQNPAGNEGSDNVDLGGRPTTLPNTGKPA